MKKIIKIVVLAVLLLGVSTGIWARRVPLEKAEHYAHNWWLQKDGNRNAVLTHVETEFENIYLFVDTGGHGFVMLAADDRSLPVLGYSLRNNFVADSMPVHVYEWVKDYDDQIQWLIDNNIEKTNEINEQWKDLENERRQLPTAYPTSKGPLVETTWNQGSPYNYKCPKVGSTSTYTGCVATATAQIMKYYNWPTTGMGSHSYTWNSKTLSADFGNTTYDWNNMINKYSSTYTTYTTTQRDAVATLMYHIGVAVEMNYGTNSSGAYDVATDFDKAASVNALRKYFKYKQTATSVYRENYSDKGWKDILKNEIDNSRPIQYSGFGSGGHSFVCDGYDVDEKFHFNWGWGGSYDGNFAIGALNPGGGGTGASATHSYNVDNAAIIGIEPDRSTATSFTVTASSNNTTYGTVTGGGTFNRYAEVTITPSAKPGYRFVSWSTGGMEVPLKFLASGDNMNITANFEPIAGDTLYYCKDAHASSYRWGDAGDMQYWGIRLPKGSLSAGKVLTHVMLYAYSAGSYTLRIYTGGFTTRVYSETFNITENEKWVTLPLSTIYVIDATKDLCVAFESSTDFPCSVSAPAANAYGTYGGSSWIQRSSDGSKYTWMIKAITAPAHEITMYADLVNLTSATKDFDLRDANLGVSNKGATVSYEIVSCTPAGIATITDGCKITATGAGTVKIQATANDSKFGPAENTIDLQISKGSLVFDNHNNTGRWDDVQNWYPHYDRLPDATNFDVDVNVLCTIPADKRAECNSLRINANGSITVASTAVLNVKGELTSDDPVKLLIKADENGSGTVVYKSGSPKATVEMYLKGTSETDVDGNIVNPQWQLRVCIVDDFALVNPNDWANIHVYRWSELSNSTGCWTENMIGSAIKLDPWWGYGFANYSASPVTLKYSGTLKNGNCQLTLNKTGSGNANVGNNMFTNSYAAPLRINMLDFENVKSSVILYNTGSWLDWKQYEGDTTSAGVGTTAGQMLVCPKNTSAVAGLPTTIPSGQSFYVVAEEDKGSVTVYYSYIDDSNPSGPMFMPAEEKEEQFNVLGMTISGKKGGDRVVLIENENCDDGYNDGYDGMKYYGDAELPQLFAVNEFGNTSINAAKTMLGQKIGVTTQSAGEVLRMTFETDRLEGFAQLQVHDFVTGKFVNVLAGEEYEFTTTGNDKARFEVVGFTMQNADEEGDSEIRVYGNRLYVGENEGAVSMCDMSGKIVWQADVRQGEWVELPELLHGVYVIKTDGSTIKIVK